MVEQLSGAGRGSFPKFERQRQNLRDDWLDEFESDVVAAFVERLRRFVCVLDVEPLMVSLRRQKRIAAAS
jgi:hypothetical protein